MGKAYKISPENILAAWGYCEDWSEGDSSAPTEWSMAGTAGSVAKESTEKKFGSYAMKIISGSSDSYKAQTSIENYDEYQGRTITFGMWVKCSTADKSRLYVNDGVAVTNSGYHTGSGDWEFLSVTVQVDESATELTFGAEVQNNAVTAYFDGGTACLGEDIFTSIYQETEDWQPDVKYNYAKKNIPHRRGVYIPEVKLGERDIKIPCNVVGADHLACRTAFDAIVKAVNNGKKDLFLYDDRVVTGYAIAHKPKNQAALRMISFTMRFIAEDPCARYISKTRKKQTISSSPTSFNLTSLGNMPTRPMITIIPAGGDMTSCTLENLTTGQVFSFSGTVSSGDELKVDYNNSAITNDGVKALADFSGRFLDIVPGTNYLKFTGDNCVIKIDWYDKWL